MAQAISKLSENKPSRVYPEMRWTDQHATFLTIQVTEESEDLWKVVRMPHRKGFRRQVISPEVMRMTETEILEAYAGSLSLDPKYGKVEQKKPAKILVRLPDNEGQERLKALYAARFTDQRPGAFAA